MFKKKDKRAEFLLFFTTFAKLTGAKLLSKELFSIKDIDEKYFFSDIYQELKLNYEVVSQKKEYTSFLHQL